MCPRKKSPKETARGSPQPIPGPTSPQPSPALKKVLAPVANELRVLKNDAKNYRIVTKANSWKGGPMYFAGIRIGKGCVGYHLMPVYVCPEVAKSIAPELKQRMQGKSCLNFRTLDDDRFAQLSELTKFSLQAYRKNKWL